MKKIIKENIHLTTVNLYYSHFGCEFSLSLSDTNEFMAWLSFCMSAELQGQKAQMESFFIRSSSFHCPKQNEQTQKEKRE